MATKHDDLSYLRQPGNWPAWPLCPVVRRRGKNPAINYPECGLVFDFNSMDTPPDQIEATPTVHILNMFQGWNKEQFNECKRYVYNCLEDMLADGWEVD